MNDEHARSEKIQAIGQLILSRPRIIALELWDGLAFVVSLRKGRGGSVHGFRYLKTGEFKPTSPGQVGKIITAFHELRDLMATETGAEWQQALVHITRPDHEIKMFFEYDDPQRWKPKITGLDMTDYATSIKPPLN